MFFFVIQLFPPPVPSLMENVQCEAYRVVVVMVDVLLLLPLFIKKGIASFRPFSSRLCLSAFLLFSLSLFLFASATVLFSWPIWELI